MKSTTLSHVWGCGLGALNTFTWLSTPRLPGQTSEVTVMPPNRLLSEGFHLPAAYTQISGHGQRDEGGGQ